jgi:GNAT superfamily N-acetyltransferase
METDADILATYPVMSQLRPNVPESDYVRRVRLQQKEVGFRLAALREEGRITCVAGYRFSRSLGWGKYLYIDDLATDENYRSRGAGKTMFAWLVQVARDAECDEVRLDSAVWRNATHRFYLRERMDIACFNFRLMLTEHVSP